MLIESKLPKVGTNIFTVMSALANEYGAINLAQGFPNFASSPRLIALVNEYMQKGLNQYAPMAGVPLLRERIAAKIERMYGIGVDPDKEITITAGGTQALFCAIAAFVKSGDEVILLEPAYDSYGPSVALCGGVPVSYALPAPHYQPDWSEIGKLVNAKTRMIVINTPHNPTGCTLKAADMDALDQLTAGTDILVLSDEVYEHLIYDGQSHQSVLKYPGLRERSLAVYSFGKTFHNTGWKTGYCVAPPELTTEFRKVHQFNVFAVNTPIQYALADFLADPEEYLSLPDFYQHKRDFFQSAMSGSRFRPLPSEGTYFQLYDYSAISDEPDTVFVKRMIAEWGVAAIPVSVFNSQGQDDKVIRLCFAKTEETLEKAAELLRGS